MSRLRVMIVDDHRVVREGLQLALEIEENIEVVGEAGEGREAVEKAQELRPRPDPHGCDDAWYERYRRLPGDPGAFP